MGEANNSVTWDRVSRALMEVVGLRDIPVEQDGSDAVIRLSGQDAEDFIRFFDNNKRRLDGLEREVAEYERTAREAITEASRLATRVAQLEKQLDGQ